MSKSICLFVTLLVVFAAIASAAPAMTVKFVGDSLSPNVSPLVEFTFTGINYADGVGDAEWYFQHPSGQDPKPDDVLYSFQPPRTKAFSDPSPALGHAIYTCWDTTTHQSVAVIEDVHSSVAYFKFNNAMDVQVEKGLKTGWTMQCAFPFSTEQKPNVLNTAFDFDDEETLEATLAWPANGVVTPSLVFKNASVKQADKDPYSTTQVDVEFTAGQAGAYNVTLNNGPYPSPFSYDDGKIADFFCSAGKDKKFARIVYVGDTTTTNNNNNNNNNNNFMVIADQLSPDNHIIVYVPSVTTETIKCSFYFGNQAGNTYVASDRQTAQISFGDVIVSRGLALKKVAAGAWGSISVSDQSATVSVSSTPLALSTAELKTNSTISFKFSSGINIATLQLSEASQETSYRNNVNCGVSKNDPKLPAIDLPATAFVDVGANKITLKDIIPPTNNNQNQNLYCTFEFVGSNALKYQNEPRLDWVKVAVDGVELASQASADTKIQLPVYTAANIDRVSHVETVENGAVTVVDTFSITENSIITVMRHPKVVIAVDGATLTVENFKDHVKCQITTPESSAKKDLKLDFDDKRFVWTADLKDLENVTAFSVLLECTRSIKQIMQWGVDITPPSTIHVSIIDPMGTRFYGFSHADSSTSPPVQKDSQTDAYPTTKTTWMQMFNIGYMTPQTYDSAALIKSYITDAGAKVVAAARFNGADGTDLKDWTITAMPQVYAQVNTASTRLNHNGGYPLSLYTNAWAPAVNFDARVANFKDAVRDYRMDSLPLYSNNQAAMTPEATNELFNNFAYVTVDVPITLVAPTATPNVQPSSFYTQWKADDALLMTNVYGTDSVLRYPSVTLDPSTEGVVIPATGCGYVAGMTLNSPRGVNFDYSANPFDAADTAEVKAQKVKELWTEFTGMVDDSNRFLCHAGEQCTMNADCADDLMCSKGVCTDMPKYLPPYVDISDDELYTAASKKYASSTSVASSVLALVVVVALALF